MSNTITVYSIENCVFCEKTRIALECAQLEHTIIKKTDDEKSNFLDRLGFVNREDRTFPRIFVNEKCIGGWKELKDMLIKGLI